MSNRDAIFDIPTELKVSYLTARRILGGEVINVQGGIGD
jgi:hypothetical protein